MGELLEIRQSHAKFTSEVSDLYMYIVYQHVNKINGKRYIGITKRKPEERWGSNGSNYNSSPHFYNAIKKYGWDNFEHEVLFENLSKDEACEKEKELIKIYNTTDRRFGYNSTTGGEMFEMTDDVKLKMSKSMIGNKNSLGKPCSKEKAKKISDAQKGKKLSNEHKKKLSESAKKRHVPCSDEKREMLRNNYPNMKKVYCVETDIVYKSVQECARQLNVHATNVSKVCNGKLKSTSGYHFIYLDDVINA